MRLSEITNGQYEEMMENGLYHSDYIEHGWFKNQAAKAHKYIERWRGKNGKWYYRYKSKAQESRAKVNRKIRNIDPSLKSTDKGKTVIPSRDSGKAGYNPYGKYLFQYGKTTELDKRNLDAGIEAGRKRAKKKGYKVK